MFSSESIYYLKLHRIINNKTTVLPKKWAILYTYIYIFDIFNNLFNLTSSKLCW